MSRLITSRQRSNTHNSTAPPVCRSTYRVESRAPSQTIKLLQFRGACHQSQSQPRIVHPKNPSTCVHDRGKANGGDTRCMTSNTSCGLLLGHTRATAHKNIGDHLSPAPCLRNHPSAHFTVHLPYAPSLWHTPTHSTVHYTCCSSTLLLVHTARPFGPVHYTMHTCMYSGTPFP